MVSCYLVSATIIDRKVRWSSMMTMKKISLTILLIAGSARPAYSISFRPSVTLLGSYTTTRNYTEVGSGTFDIRNRETNFGFEVTNKFYVSKPYFIKTGIRYNTYKTDFAASSDLPGYSKTTYPITWERKWQQIAVPVQAGWDFSTRNGNAGDVYIGASVGLIMISSATDGVQSPGAAANSSGSTVTSSITDDDLMGTSFMSTIDLGFSYHPFRSAPRFSVGALYSLQLNSTLPHTYNGTVSDGNHGHETNYSMVHSQQSTNYSLTLTYKLGKDKSRQKGGNKLNCPE